MSSPDQECCICFEIIGIKNNCVTECGHSFCFKCLAMAMSRKNACPCCRAPLVDVPEEEEEGEDEGDEDEDDDEEDEDEGDEDDEHDNMGDVEDVVRSLEMKGVTMMDVVSMLLNRYSKKDEKYTAEYIDKLNATFDETEYDVYNEHNERQMFAAEDVRAVLANQVDGAVSEGQGALEG